MNYKSTKPETLLEFCAYPGKIPGMVSCTVQLKLRRHSSKGLYVEGYEDYLEDARMQRAYDADIKPIIVNSG